MMVKLLLDVDPAVRTEAMFEQLGEEGKRRIEASVNKQLIHQLEIRLLKAEQKGDEAAVKEILGDLSDLAGLEMAREDAIEERISGVKQND